MTPIVELQRHGDVAVIVVDNPPVNTITAAARAGMTDAIKQVAADKSVRAVLLRTGGNNFFTGADISEFSGPPKEAEYRELDRMTGFTAGHAMLAPIHPLRSSPIEGFARDRRSDHHG